MSTRTDTWQGKSDSKVSDDNQSARWTLGQSEIEEIVAIDKINRLINFDTRNDDCKFITIERKTERCSSILCLRNRDFFVYYLLFII